MNRSKVLLGSTAAVLLVAGVVLLWWLTRGPQVDGGAGPNDGGAAGAAGLVRTGPAAGTGADGGTGAGEGRTAELSERGPAQGAFVAPPPDGAVVAAELPLTGAALDGPWMPALPPTDPAWDPVLEARQRFAAVEGDAVAWAMEGSGDWEDVVRAHSDDLRSMTERAIALREAGFSDRARLLEEEWARLDRECARSFVSPASAP